MDRRESERGEKKREKKREGGKWGEGSQHYLWQGGGSSMHVYSRLVLHRCLEGGFGKHVGKKSYWCSLKVKSFMGGSVVI